MQRAYRHSTRTFSVLLAVLGVAMVVSALVHGGGALSLGVILGALFAGLGAGRALLARAPDSRR